MLQAREAAAAIIVTGERLARKAADADSSLSVATKDSIEALSGAYRLEQVLAMTPNLQLGSGGEGPTIRGQDTNGALRDMPAFLGGSRPRVTLQVDGRAVTYNELAFGISGLWDVERLEVYRSPQTTTQGRNSIAGAIFIETGSPTFDWQARARLIEGSYDTHQDSAVLTGPIVADQLAFRLSGDRRRSRTSSRITSTAVGIDYNREEADAVRFKLLATPAAMPGASLTAIVSHDRSISPQVEGVRIPFRVRRDPVATYGVFAVTVDALTLRADYRPGQVWTTAASVSFGNASIRRFAPAGFGEARIAARDRTAEIVTTWAVNPSLRVLLGVNVTNVALDQAIDLTAALLGRGAFRDRQNSLGVFGQAEWQIDPRFKLTGGVRYQRDRQVRTGALGLGSLSPLALSFNQRFDAVLPKLSLSFEPNADLRLGILVQRAANPGGVTLDTRRRIADTFDPESLWAYEGFARLSLFDGKADVAANVFRYSLHNTQRTITSEFMAPGGIVTTAEVGNAPEARSSGAEMELRWRPTPQLKIQATGGLLRTRITRTLSAADPLLGKEFQRSPHLTAALAVDWRPLPPLRLSAQVRHNTGYFSDDANDPLRRINGATVADVRAGCRSGPLELSGYVRNLFDSFYLTYLFSPTSRLATAGDPREVGAALDLRF